jgi:hypothetical protein
MSDYASGFSADFQVGRFGTLQATGQINADRLVTPGPGATTNNVKVGSTTGVAFTTASNNVLVGASAGNSITTGTNNIAIGTQSLSTATQPTNTVAIGRDALVNVVTSTDSVSIGTSAGIRVERSVRCALVGHNIAQFGSGNTANIEDTVCVGFNAGNSLQGSPDGVTATVGNTLIGRSAGSNLTAGLRNTCVGNSAGGALVATNDNTLIGSTANIAGGTASGTFVSNATLVGATASVGVATGPVSNVTALGFGAAVPADTSNYVRIGNASVATIFGQVAFTNASDIRDKEEIREVDGEKALQAILAVKPVHYMLKDRHRDKKDYGQQAIGFIAQQVEEVEDALDAQDFCLVSTANEEQMALTSAHVIPLLVKSIQELAARLGVQPSLQIPIRSRTAYGYAEEQPWLPPQPEGAQDDEDMVMSPSQAAGAFQ